MWWKGSKTKSTTLYVKTPPRIQMCNNAAEHYVTFFFNSIVYVFYKLLELFHFYRFSSLSYIRKSWFISLRCKYTSKRVLILILFCIIQVKVNFVSDNKRKSQLVFINIYSWPNDLNIINMPNINQLFCIDNFRAQFLYVEEK